MTGETKPWKRALSRFFDATSALGARPWLAVLRRCWRPLFFGTVAVVAVSALVVDIANSPGVTGEAEEAFSIGLLALWFGALRGATYLVAQQAQAWHEDTVQLLEYLYRAAAGDFLMESELAAMRVLLWHRVGLANGDEAWRLTHQARTQQLTEGDFRKLIEKINGRGLTWRPDPAAEEATAST